ncbi:MAG TPA: hypothetical protein VNH13_07215, partial [Candidatus Acidoferrales bacterium]|nr:hypothetical protein [Candidatus Acidoferrales bacterium]
DAQSALLKTLEEPPAGATIVLCADDEERLLPTIRSRCVRLRLGPVPRRDVETILVERGAADATAAARYARIAAGRPGVALAYAAAPDAAIIRAEIARTLLDLATASRTRRLTGVRELAGRAAELVRALEVGGRRAAGDVDEAAASGTARGGRAPAARRTRGAAAAAAPSEPVTSDADPAADAVAPVAARVPAAERRAAALALLAVWRDVLRDLAATSLKAPRLVRDVELLEDLELAATATSPARVGAALERLDVAGERLEGNVSPELVLDVLALAHGR